MSTRARTALEVGIILLVAAGVEFVPGGRNTANGLYAAISAGFAAGLIWVGLRAYREHHFAIFGLGDGRRALLYGAIAALIVTVAARSRMWQGSLGEFAFWVLIGLALYTLFALYRFARRY